MRLSVALTLALSALAWAAMPGGVVIEGELTSAPAPGQSTPLDIRIHKGGLDYFGRLLIQAPEGCRLEADRLFGGSFRWDEQENVAVISWLKLPEPDQFDIRLDLRVAPNAPSGPQTLEWEFSFIRNNDRETVRPAPLHFALGSAEASDPTPPNTGSAQATRSWTTISDGWLATLNLDGLPSHGFVKVEHALPPRCQVEIVHDGGATVRREGGFLTFLWFDYQPSGPITYKWADCSLSEAQNSSAILSYVHEEQPVELSVIEIGVSESAAEVTAEEAEDHPDIRFEVQIAALKKRRVTDYFQRRLDFRHEVKEERVDDWVKYTHGSFANYAAARDHRNTLRAQFDVEGPFVVGRREGQRISVQEALTRTGQHWVP